MDHCGHQVGPNSYHVPDHRRRCGLHRRFNPSHHQRHLQQGLLWLRRLCRELRHPDQVLCPGVSLCKLCVLCVRVCACVLPSVRCVCGSWCGGTMASQRALGSAGWLAAGWLAGHNTCPDGSAASALISASPPPSPTTVCAVQCADAFLPFYSRCGHTSYGKILASHAILWCSFDACI